MCNQFLHQIIEGDELCTKIDKNTPAAESEGWTIVLMDRASRFIWDMRCGKKDKELFLDAMNILSQLVDSADGLSLFTDG